MTRDDLVRQHTARWEFRARGPFEGAQQYVDAVVAFLETRDWAAAFEVRLGKAQTEWTADDVRAFEDHVTRPRHRPDITTPIAKLFVEVGTVPTTMVALVEIARAGFDLLARKLPPGPDGLPVYAHVITLDGRVAVTTVSANERIAVLKTAAQQLPLYGFVLVFDAFVHSVDRVGGTATKQDALLAHVGTREDRHVLTRRYTVAGRTVRFEPESDVDLRAAAVGGPESFRDPYAEVFVSVPPVTRPQ